MSEENEVRQEPIAHEPTDNPNGALENRLNDLECEAGEALLAIKVGVTVESDGTKLGISFKVIGPNADKIHSLCAGMITMAAHNVATAAAKALRQMLSESFTAPILRDTEKEFADLIANKSKAEGVQPQPEPTSREVPDGV